MPKLSENAVQILEKRYLKKNKEGKIVYSCEFFDFNMSFEFDSMDVSLREGNHRITPQKIAEHCRKLVEIKLTKEALKDLASGDCIVRDGDLEINATGEKEEFESLFKEAKEKNVGIVGFSKTTTLLTDTGNSAAAVLETFSCAATSPTTLAVSSSCLGLPNIYPEFHLKVLLSPCLLKQPFHLEQHPQSSNHP